MVRKLAAAFLMATVMLMGAEAQTQQRVLFINSYHKGYAWSDDIEHGLLDRITARNNGVEVSFEYLDSKRFRFDELAPTIAESMYIKYREYLPNLIVTADNTAFAFVKQYRDYLFPGVPVVFCGFNNFTSAETEGMTQVTGVTEQTDVIGLVNLALRIQPEITTLAFIVSSADNTNRILLDSVVSEAYPRFKGSYNVVILKDEPLKEVERRLALLPRTTAVFLTGQTSDFGEGRALTPEESGAMISGISSFPSYTFWEFYLGKGVLGGALITGYDQGKEAADMALQILSGTPAASIPPLLVTPTRLEFDWKVMAKLGIRVSSLPPGSEIINKPESPWTVWPLQAAGILILVISETISILMLLRLVRSRRTALRELAEERAQLEQRVEERTAELKNVNERLQIASETDPLTALSNRRAFSKKLEQEFLRLRRSGGLLSLIMLDIDHFKRFNDTYGHLEGDECLIRVAAVIAEAIHRPYDLAARFGGEEFIVILPETGREGAMKVALMIQEGVAALSIPHATSETAGYLTVSMGVITAVPFREDKPLTLVDIVDGIMYRAKNTGRNRIECVDLAHEHASGEEARP